MKNELMCYNSTTFMLTLRLIIASSFLCQNIAFVTQMPHSSHRVVHSFTSTFRNNRHLLFAAASFDSNESNNSDDDIESMRQRLEQTLSSGSSSGNNSSSGNVSATTKGLSTTAKEHRKHEIELLQELAYSDEPMNDLWALWFVEKGPGPASQLLATQDDFQKIEDDDYNVSSRKFEEAELKLREIIREHGTTEWAEPINRLATIYYLQGKFKESIAMCELVLEIKPWHFGCLSGIVVCHAELGDRTNARLWASRRLPPLEAIDRREEWVDRAVDEAVRSLERHSNRPLDALVKEDFVSGKLGIRRDMSDEAGGSISRIDDDAWQ